MYKLIEWSEDLDLNYFYAEADRRGFENNSSQKVMIDCFKNEREFKAWILYKDDLPVGSVAAHSLDILGPNAYRICVRTCAFTEYRPISGLLTVNRMIREHQHITPQFYIPACIEWAGVENDLYISSNNSPVGTQRMVHNIYCPTMEKMGLLKKTHDIEYRGHLQSFWKLDSKKFLQDLERYPRWY